MKEGQSEREEGGGRDRGRGGRSMEGGGREGGVWRGEVEGRGREGGGREDEAREVWTTTMYLPTSHKNLLWPIDQPLNH